MGHPNIYVYFNTQRTEKYGATSPGWWIQTLGLLEEGDVDDREAERDEKDEKAQPEEDDLVLHVVEVDRLRRKIIKILCND